MTDADCMTTVTTPLTPAATTGGTPTPVGTGAGVAALTNTVAGLQAGMSQLVAGIAGGGPAGAAGGVSSAVNLLQSAESAMTGAKLQDALAQLGPGIGLDSFAGVSGGGPGMKDPSTLDAAELAKFGMGPLVPQGGNMLTDQVLKEFGMDPQRVHAAQQGLPDPSAAAANAANAANDPNAAGGEKTEENKKKDDADAEATSTGSRAAESTSSGSSNAAPARRQTNGESND